MAARRLTRATIYDFSDREFLHLINDASDNEGWATTEDVANLVRLNAEYPNQNIGQRCGYMARKGVEMIERHPKGKQWRLTPRGDSYMKGHVQASIANALEAVGDGGLLEVISITTRRMNSSALVRIAARREFRHGDARYRR